MPKALETKLKKQAQQLGLTGARADAYTYGALRATGWKPAREKANSAKKR
jgi:hypothetical protein